MEVLLEHVSTGFTSNRLVHTDLDDIEYGGRRLGFRTTR